MDQNQNKFIQSNSNNFQNTPNPDVNDMHQHDNDFLNNVTQYEQNQQTQNTDMHELENILKQQKNKFINNDTTNQENSLTSLNIETGDGPRVDYSKDPKVQENLNQIKGHSNTKNTMTINSEGKIFLIIIVLLLIFIFVLPTIFDYIRGIQYK